jgi:general stress protein YciG
MTEEKKRRGFAVMDPAVVSAWGAKGGRIAQARGTAHRFTTEEAREAGRKGAIASAASRRAKREGAQS